MKVVAALFLFLAETTFAGGLSAPFDLDSAARLPQGVRNFRYKLIGTSVAEKYNAVGNIEPLGTAFENSITFQDMIDGADDKGEELATKGYLDAKSVNPNSVIGETTGEVRVAKTANVPVFAYGLASWWTTALVVPITTTNIEVDTGFVANEDGQRFHDYIEQEDFKTRTAKKLREKTTNAVVTSSKDKGYKELKSETLTEVGDIVLVNKFKGFETAMFALAFKQVVVLPTGRPQDPNKVVDIAPGDGQLDLGVGVVTELKPFSKSDWKIIAGANYTSQLPAYVTRRIPESKDKKLSEDIDKDTYMNLGDIYSAQLGTRVPLAPGLSFTTGYTYQYKEGDIYDGGLYGDGRYSVLGEDTEQEMSSALVGLGYSTVPFFREKTYSVPWEVNLTYAKVLRGRNVNRADLVQAELAMFF